MRSKEVEEEIIRIGALNVKTIAERYNDGIKRIEEESKNLDLLNEGWKQVIRDKIKELEEDLEIYDTDSEDVRIAKFEKRAQIIVLEEILGKEN